jgi:hypothetical protein
MAVLTAPAAPASGQKSDAKSAVQANPFTKASRRKVEKFWDWTGALGASTTNLQQQDVPATGYLRHIVLDVQASGTVGATYTPDAPFNVIASVQLTDVNGQPIVLLTGYDLFLANLIGGYSQHYDPRLSPNYSLTATGFRFQLRIPVEIVQRNALGALANLNAAMTYKVKTVLAPSSEVYASNAAGHSLHIQAHVESWANPNAVDLKGTPNVTAPPALGTTQNWSEYTAPVVVGQNTIRLPRVGNTIRNLIFVNRDATGARTDAGIPTSLAKFLDGNQWSNNSFAYETERLFELYGLTSDRPAGVWALALTDDFDGTPGEEIGDYWLTTTGATRLEVQGVWTAAGSLQVITNDILAFQGSGGAGQTLG